ncbi:MAG: chemotaxis protein CheX [Mycobacteriales bacterium]
MSVTEAEQVVDGEQIAEITRDVWDSFLSMELAVAGGDPLAPLPGSSVTGCVHVSGEWNGTIFLQASAEHAVAAAEAMFAADPGSLSPGEVSDALGELTNMVGGNIKSLLPGPSRLSIPTVAEGEHYTVRVPGASLVDAVTLVGPAGPVHITVWSL